jgi:hypothetical protein
MMLRFPPEMGGFFVSRETFFGTLAKPLILCGFLLIKIGKCSGLSLDLAS